MMSWGIGNEVIFSGRREVDSSWRAAAESA